VSERALIAGKPNELTLGALAARDEIVFVTDHNTYRFVVEDPGRGRGVLRGGRVPLDQTAFFCGVFDRPYSFLPATLLAGTRALFVIEEADRASFRRILTSNLLDVRVVRGASMEG
jgi:hypothetical protein